MDEQRKIVDDELKAYGFIRNMSIKERDGKDPMYKFQLRYLDKNDNLVEPDDWYSGFKQPPGTDGDYVIFLYKINGVYKNVKEILDIKITHDKPLDTDINEIKKDVYVSEPEVNNENEIIIPNGSKLDTPYYALLLVSTINLCIKSGNTSYDEIVAQYNRFIKLVKNG